MICPVFFGCQGTRLSPEERAFFTRSQAVGLILFARNIENPQQLKNLVADFHQCIRHDYPMVLIDQEGGRVQRFGPPHWQQWPSAADIGQLHQESPKQAIALAQASVRTIAHSLIDAGIRMNASPVLDMTYESTHEVIGDRSFGSNKESVVELASHYIDGFLQSGIIPVMKHIPGHGRAVVDSHFELPRVGISKQELMDSDGYPFMKLAQTPAAMTAHILYTAIDDKLPISLSPKAVSWLRQELGYQGLLISDCLHMKALQGSIASLASQAQYAGLDLLLDSHSDLAVKEKVFQAVQPMSDSTMQRLHEAWQQAGKMESLASADDWKAVAQFVEKSNKSSLEKQDPTEALTKAK